jgi:mono/diheme cytochrome c family protein
MPAYDWKLSDDEIAAVATYVRNSWGNAAPSISPADVASLRKDLASRNQ